MKRWTSTFGQRNKLFYKYGYPYDEYRPASSLIPHNMAEMRRQLIITDEQIMRYMDMLNGDDEMEILALVAINEHRKQLRL